MKNVSLAKGEVFLTKRLKLVTMSYHKLQFKYFGSIIQNDGEIDGDVNHKIQARWLVEMEESLRNFMRHKSTAQAEGKTISDNSKTYDIVLDRMLGG